MNKDDPVQDASSYTTALDEEVEEFYEEEKEDKEGDEEEEELSEDESYFDEPFRNPYETFGLEFDETRHLFYPELDSDGFENDPR